ncbi:hypothetical protein FQR65_LT05060 [Abscondita terminalis]|nr:hypothetical protein FQR65_LT05060 [Abscondita terminalis]
MSFTFQFIAIATIAIVSPSLGQLFGGRQNFPSGGFSQQAGYKVGPAWGSLSQTFDRRGYGGPLLGSPISVGAGADYLSKQGHGISGSLSMVPGVGGQGSVRGQVGLLNSGNHHVNAFAQHNRALDKNLKPYGPETNSAGINYVNSNGASAFLSGSQTHGAPAIGTVGGSIPLINKGNAGIMALKFAFIAIATIAIVSPSLGQFFGGRQNFPSGGFSQQAGYKVGPAWGSLSQTFDRRGFGGPLLSSPISVGAGADYLSKQGHGISGSLNVIPGVGGQGSVRGQVGLLNSGNHHVNAFAQHNRALDKNLKPFGPETNSAGLNYANSNGASAFLSGSQTHGAPATGTVGGSIPLINKGNAGVSLTGQTTFGHGMKPDHQIGIQGEIKF